MTIPLLSVPPSFAPAIRNCGPHFRSMMGFSAAINVLYLAPTIYMMQIYDRVVPTSGTNTLIILTLLVAAAILTLTALDALRARLMTLAALRMNRIMARPILDRLMSRPATKPGDPSTRQAMREFDTLRSAMTSSSAIALFDIPWTPIYLLVATLIHPLLGLVVLIGATILILLAVTNERRTRTKSREAHSANAAAAVFHEAAINNTGLIRALGMSRAVVARQIEDRRAGLEATADFQAVSGRYSAIVKFVRMFLQSLALGTGAWLAIDGRISIGAIMAASVLLSRALSPIEQVVGGWPTLLQARLAVQTLGTLLTDDRDAPAERTALPAPQGHVEAIGLSVRSPDGASILLRNVSFTVAPGEILGVIGSSGAGKSTLARIVAGAAAADLGELRIDGAEFIAYDPETIAAHIGYLPQDAALLPGTIGENISRYAAAGGVPRDLVDAAVVDAAKVCGLHEFILTLPDGYDTQLRSGGFGLSAGQQQRVALARALYGAPAILVLDEPNAALDAPGEALLFKAISRARERGAAVIVIAHRASILSSATKLLVLAGGEVAHFGPRDAVMAALRQAEEGQRIVAINRGAKK